MKKFALFFCALFAGLWLAAQEVPSAISGETYLYAERDTCSLYLDICRPTEGAETTFEGQAKPAIVYVFGGGFVGGQRVDDFKRLWFQRLNDNGYTVVTIDYRLGMKGYKVGKGLSGLKKASDQFYLSQQMGVEDLFSAIVFMAENQEELGIDPMNLVVAGSSAGAIISLAAEYDIVCGRTGALPEGFQFKGVMSFAGGVVSLNGAPKYPSAPCPTLLMHGTADGMVAYNKLSMGGRGIWGSDFLATQWAKKGYTGWCIYRFKDRLHDVAAYMSYLWDIEQAFLEQNVILGHSRTVDATVDDPTLPTWSITQMDLSAYSNL